jgi:hypothetical protein
MLNAEIGVLDGSLVLVLVLVLVGSCNSGCGAAKDPED